MKMTQDTLVPADRMKRGQIARIVRLEDMVIAGKLMSMGVLPEAEIELIRRNALGYTLIYRINARFKIALRQDEASSIFVDLRS